MSTRDYVKLLATDHRTTFQRIAKIIGVSRNTITNWLSAPWSMRAEDAVAICTAMGASDIETEHLFKWMLRETREHYEHHCDT